MIRSLLLQSAAFVGIFLLISWFKEIDLLEANGSVTAPAYTLNNLESQPFTDKSFIGKPTLIYFWAPWCTVCKLSMPNLQDYFEANKESVNVVAIALSYESVLEVEEFVRDKQFTFPVLLGSNQVAQDYKISAFPTYYLLDSEGSVVSKSMGYSTELGMMFRTLYNL